ncbi:MAG TPA: hypothetical protein VMB83_00355 [Roseiarcus sp.]|nr:hypothetical protein [Roseiarcus sp.]
MSPAKIMIIRHAEKPVPEGADGVAPGGLPDPESLSEIGWRRAHALVGFFKEPSAEHIQTPDIIFAAAPEVGSKRPAETVTPLAETLWTEADVAQRFNTSIPKEKVQRLARSLIAVDGVALVSWEHKLIPAVVAALPNPPATPTQWPGCRFDVVWILDARSGGWDFHQTPQMLLDGDQNSVIPFSALTP